MSAPALDILAPGLLGPVPEAVSDVLGEVGELAALRRLLGRGRAVALSPGTPDQLVGHLLGAADPGVAGPLAAGVMSGQRSGYWSVAAGCHLIADRDRLMLQAGPAERMTVEEAESIAASFNAMFAGEGWRLHASEGELILNSHAPLPAGLASLSEVSGGYLDDYLPAGDEARPWRRMLNELQMMLFEHPVNEAREQHGQPPVNGLWFWGCGSAIDSLPRLIDRVSGEPVVLRGMASLMGAQHVPAVARASQLGELDGRMVVHWPDAADALAAGDATDWLTAIGRFEDGWARELVSGLNNGSWGVVRLHVAPGWRWTIRKTDLKRVWRLIRPLRHHLITAEGA